MSEKVLTNNGTNQPNPALRKHKMTLFTALFMVISLTAGGYFGLEDMVSLSGPGLTILILIFFPFFWSIPQALIAAELGSAMPEEGGYYIWVRRAFGEFWGFQSGWWRTVSCYIDSTLYIILAAAYINVFIPLTPLQNFLVMAAIVVFFTVINLIGIKEVGRVTSALMIFVFITLGIFIVFGALNWQYNPVVPFVPEGQSVMTSLGWGIAFCIWIYSGYESMGTMAGEVSNARKIIPKATLLSVPIVTALYVLPIIFGLGSYGSYYEWSVDYGITFSDIVASWGVPGLVPIFTLGALACFFALYNSYLASASRGYYVLAEDKLSPPILSKLNKRFKTPHIAIISMGVINLFLSQFGFATLVVINVLLFMFSYLAWFLAAVVLRVKEPNMERPFRIPFGTKGMVAMVVAPVIICVTALFTNGLDYLIWGCVGLLSGPICYVIFKKMYGGIDGVKVLTKEQKRSVVGLIALILACLIIGGGLLYLLFYHGYYPYYY